MKLIIFLSLVAAVLGNDATIAIEMFTAIDINSDRAILLDEMMTCFNNDDVNADGFLSLQEFTAGKHPGAPPLDIEDAFKFFDKRDKQEDDRLDRSAAVFLFIGLDTNENGVISLEEFIKNYEKLFADDEEN
ncbi:uncharacterized protein LOC112569208 [Pomacea canaliculata]|uniref:uncharacterized protein LOC112569208 n=1 Tax=Pomacea canaliculata TaxID=400727 RepID=UPI000D739E39|nr:uncharacterized protein LOC112569208 [Pomacea canaliculata]XP_025102722.1 uncharacterized protein LOC112569208 [Pomacea canaliculata]